MPGLSSLNAVGVGDPNSGFDLMGLFMSAHPVVKGVMVLLIGMLLVGIYIIFYKALYVRRAARESAQFTESFWRSRDIEQIYKHAQMLRWSPVSQMFLAGYTELAKIASDERLKNSDDKMDNIERALRKAQAVEGTKLESMVPFLASTGSAAPFIGLFGTVIGIMITFNTMGHGAKLNDIVPHIAEALFATAIGLVAAIPSVLAYNYFTRRIRVLRSEMETFEQDYLNIIKRHFLH